MVTPTLFLEPASGHTKSITTAEALSTTLQLISTLLSIRKVNRRIALNSPEVLSEVLVAPNETLASSLVGRHEEWLFLRDVAARSPIYAGLEDFRDKAGGWQAKTASQVDAIALAWATLCKTGTVSFDAHPEWKTPTVEAHCLLLNEDAAFVSSIESVNNLSCPSHVSTHDDWLRSLGASDHLSALWERRSQDLPGLRFLADTEKQLRALYSTGAPYAQVVELLKTLNEDALKWNGKDEPTYSVKVALGEHDQRR